MESILVLTMDKKTKPPAVSWEDIMWPEPPEPILPCSIEDSPGCLEERPCDKSMCSWKYTLTDSAKNGRGCSVPKNQNSCKQRDCCTRCGGKGGAPRRLNKALGQMRKYLDAAKEWVPIQEENGDWRSFNTVTPSDNENEKEIKDDLRKALRYIALCRGREDSRDDCREKADLEKADERGSEEMLDFLGTTEDECSADLTPFHKCFSKDADILNEWAESVKGFHSGDLTELELDVFVADNC